MFNLTLILASRSNLTSPLNSLYRTFYWLSLQLKCLSSSDILQPVIDVWQCLIWLLPAVTLNKVRLIKLSCRDHAQSVPTKCRLILYLTYVTLKYVSRLRVLSFYLTLQVVPIMHRQHKINKLSLFKQTCLCVKFDIISEILNKMQALILFCFVAYMCVWCCA